MIVPPGSTSVSLQVQIVDDTGIAVTGLVAATWPTTYYSRVGETLPSAISLSNLSAQNSAYSSGGVKELSGGWYRLDVPDAAFATKSRLVSIIGEASGKHVLCEAVTVGKPQETPKRSGTVWYCGAGGSDSNDGLTWDNRWATPLPGGIGGAHVASAGDTILVSGSVSLGANSMRLPAGVALVGSDWSTARVANTGDNNLITVRSNNLVENLRLALAATATAFTVAADAGQDVTYSTLRRVWIERGTGGGTYGVIMNPGVGNTVKLLIDQCVILTENIGIDLVICASGSRIDVRGDTYVESTAGVALAMDSQTNGTVTMVGGVLKSASHALNVENTTSGAIATLYGVRLFGHVSFYDVSNEGTLSTVTLFDCTGSSTNGLPHIFGTVTLKSSYPQTGDSYATSAKLDTMLLLDETTTGTAGDYRFRNNVYEGIASHTLLRSFALDQASAPKYCLLTGMMSVLYWGISGTTLTVYSTTGGSLWTFTVGTTASVNPATSQSP